MKIVRSFRLTPETVDLLVEAAKETGVAQGDILDACIINCIGGVKERLAAKAKEEQEQRATALARIKENRRPVGRPRKASTRLKESPAEPVLKKRQQS